MDYTQLLMGIGTIVFSLLSSIAVVGFAFGRLAGRVDGYKEGQVRIESHFYSTSQEVATNRGALIEYGKAISNLTAHRDETPSKDDFRRLEDRFESLRKEVQEMLNRSP